MKSLGTSKSEHDINLLMQQHIAEHDRCEARWSNELHQLQESQRNEYRDWVAAVYSEMESYDKKDKSKDFSKLPLIWTHEIVAIFCIEPFNGRHS